MLLSCSHTSVKLPCFVAPHIIIAGYAPYKTNLCQLVPNLQVFTSLPWVMIGILHGNLFFPMTLTQVGQLSHFATGCHRFDMQKAWQLTPTSTKNSETKLVAWNWKQEKVCQPVFRGFQICSFATIGHVWFLSFFICDPACLQPQHRLTWFFFL